jgi:hypothetical protein
MVAYASGCTSGTPIGIGATSSGSGSSGASSRIIDGGRGSGGTSNGSSGSTPMSDSGSGSGSASGSSAGVSPAGSSSGSSSGSASSTPSGGVDAGQTDQTCAAMSTGQACITCCQQIHTPGIQALVRAIQACDCGSSGQCQTQCSAEYCMNGTVMTPGDPCDTCVGNSLVVTTADGGMGAGPCYSQVTTTCMGDTACNAYMACGNPCANIR